MLLIKKLSLSVISLVLIVATYLTNNVSVTIASPSDSALYSMFAFVIGWVAFPVVVSTLVYWAKKN